MSGESLPYIFLNAAIINNFVLALFLGICPILGVSAKLSTAFPMGVATAFVMLIASVSAWLINLVLGYFDLMFLSLIAYIAVIASAVQLVEMTVKKFSPALYQALGIFLPLITSNCAILGVALFQTSYEFDFLQSLFYSLGAGAGFILAIVLMAGLRERIDLADVPSIARGAAMSLMLAGVLSLAFMGFAGLGG
ncbi:RnfABCDGE type electron transport complex subunit A [Halorhodospira halochloris]|uniref:Electron transport complex protein RnfA n=1 Tax=Halorhodospira halochloris TaxID=1052 RepID=A0A110B520_HALHR|nr:RnfABCDGE type electron transport complex subunit A [Halorhodospira halochloris]MBK1651218.1 electron transport complex subunit A [Halorhodospira halochloris]MCG5530731.1 RnfABCDGE type electron transport complex subunit A [Halorhodospira halochloris]MCG5547637.1 RnfABCDGE type electron transport complex subunit A [Halorhodospira halochloris]BAU57490.1 electron transport complex protein RnfA [Halorhodospira halochloris]